MRLFISNGLIVDPSSQIEALGDIEIKDGIISQIKLYKKEEKRQESLYEEAKRKANDASYEAEEIRQDIVHIDAKGKLVIPGLVDLHVHFREPGFEYKEDIKSGCMAAAKGGVTTVCVMPNTNPVIDSASQVRLVREKAKEAKGIDVLVISAITKGQEGKELCDFESMSYKTSKEAQVQAQTKTELQAKIKTEANEKAFDEYIIGISEDGKTLYDENLMREAMIKAKELGLTVFSHAEPEAEIVKRDIKLASETGCRIHFCHISEEKSIKYIEEAKRNGLNVTAETAPHYFALTKNQVAGDTNRKMNPPLQEDRDKEAVISALKSGILDAIATDHAPHSPEEKSVAYADAPNGVIGLETSFAVSYTELVKTGHISLKELIRKMSLNPAKIIGIEKGSIKVGRIADLAIIDIDEEYQIKAEDFASKSKNSPFIGKKVYGKVDCTIACGKVVWRNKND